MSKPVNPDDLYFDPNERVVPANVERTKPLARQDRVNVAEPPKVPQSPTQKPQEAVRRVTIQEGPVTRPAQDVAPLQEPESVEAAEDGEATQPKLSVKKLPLTMTTGERKITSAFEDVWLPSGFVPYEWKSLLIRRFTVGELSAIVRARTSGNMRHLIRAIDSTLSVPVTDLTQGDFWYIMYWHRLNSYKKSPFVIDWTCSAKKHLERVAAGEVEAQTLKNLVTVNRSNLVENRLDEVEYKKWTDAIFETYQVHVTPHSLADFVSALDEDEELTLAREELTRKRDEAAKEGDVATFIDEFFAQEEQQGAQEERGFLYRYASVMSKVHGESLTERVAFLNTCAPDLLDDLEEFIKVCDHGVVETWTVECKECKESKKIEQTIDALTFLPSLQRGGLA